MHKHHWEEMPEPRAFSCRGPGWKTKLCCLFLFWSQLCIAFCKDHGWTAQLKSKPDLPRLCNKAALSRMRKNVAINFFKLQRELNRDLLAPGQVLDGMEENLLSRFLDELISWCVSPFLHASFTTVTEMQIHSICEHQTFTGGGFWVTDQIGRQHLSTCGSRPQACWESADFGCRAELLPSQILALKLDARCLHSAVKWNSNI